jgi:hypothetical protein
MSPANHPFLRELQKIVSLQFQLSTQETDSYEALRRLLSKYLQELMDRDFHRLLLLLYRVDVSEQRLMQLLKENPEKDAAGLIADLVLERQLEKIKTRRETGRRDNNISDEERW